MCRSTLRTRKSATKTELNLTRNTKPMISPAKKGRAHSVKNSALPASRAFEDGAAKAAFQAPVQPMARPAQARLQTESHSEMKAVPKRLSGDSKAATPRTMEQLKMTAGRR